MKIYLGTRPSATLEAERGAMERVWIAADQLDRWLRDLRFAGCLNKLAGSNCATTPLPLVKCP